MDEFQAALFYALAHDPTGVTIDKVPMELRSEQLTHIIQSAWFRLDHSRQKVSLPSDDPDWSELNVMIQEVVKMRQDGQFMPSRNYLKTGKLQIVIDRVKTKWASQWLKDKDELTFSISDPAFSELVSSLKVLSGKLKVASPVRKNKTASEDFPLPLGIGLLIAGLISGYVAAYNTKKEQTEADVQVIPAPPKKEVFDYSTWIAEFSDSLAKLKAEATFPGESLSQFSKSLSEFKMVRENLSKVSNKEEFEDRLRHLNSLGKTWENICKGMQETQKKPALEDLINQVIKLCEAIESGKDFSVDDHKSAAA
jgi:hypothetical protein